MTDEELKQWETSESDINNDLHIHFQEWGRWDWCEIADEGRRVYGVMFGEIEDFSPIDAVISSVAAHADHMAYEAVAAALGLDATELRIVVAEWSEKQDALPPPVSFEKLQEMMSEYRAEWADRQSEPQEKTIEKDLRDKK